MIPIRNDRSMGATAEPWPDGVRRVPSPRLPNAASARLSQADYEAWLLPPAPRDGMERVIGTLSLAAGAGAIALFSAGLWLIA